MPVINNQRSGVIPGVGANKLLITLDGATRDELDAVATRQMAQEAAASFGFGMGGLCAPPVIGPIGTDGEIINDATALDPNTTVVGFRAEFTYANKA